MRSAGWCCGCRTIRRSTCRSSASRLCSILRSRRFRSRIPRPRLTGAPPRRRCGISESTIRFPAGWSSGENISQAAQFVESGNAQAGLIALSHALAPAMKDKGRYWTVPLDAYPTLNQAAVVLSKSKQQEAARKFLEFLRTPEATSLLTSYGFSLPRGEAFALERKTEMNWEAFWLTVRLAAIVSTLLLAIGIPIAYWLTYSRWRWKFLVEAAVALPIVLPPTVLGFYVLVALGSRSPLGRWWESLTGHTLAFTFEGLVIGSLLYSLPFAVQPFAASFGAVDRTLLRASASLGHSPLQTFRRVVLPLSKAGLVTGFALSFAHTLGEFGVVLMVGGNIPGVTRTISIDIYDQVQAANYSSANQTALVLLVISFVVLSVVYGAEPASLGGGSMAVKIMRPARQLPARIGNAANLLRSRSPHPQALSESRGQLSS